MLPEWWESDKPWIIADCLEVMKSMPDKSVNLLLADLPYNEGKDTWDNIKNYNEWWDEKVNQFKRILKDNGVFYFFHMNMETSMELHQICKKHGFVFRQMVTLNKGLQAVAGRTSENLRSFPKATEYLFYYTFQDDTKGHSDIFVDIRKYMLSEKQKSGLKSCDIINKLLGVSCAGGGMAAHYFNLDNKIWELPTKEQYSKLQSTGFFKREYEDLRTEYEDLRYTFNLPYGVTDVWDFDTYKTPDVPHATPKPMAAMERIINASSNPDDIVFDPFLGSGTTLAACRKTGRIGLGCEINPDYEAIIEKRSMQNISKLDYFGVE